MLHKTIIGFFSVMLLAVSLQGQPHDSLQQYLSEAAENNPNLKLLFHKYLAALERIPQVGALPDPEVAFRYFALPVYTRVGPQMFQLSASQWFPWIGKLQADKRSAAAQARYRHAEFENAKAKLFQEVKQTWYQLYATKRSIAIHREHLKLLTSHEAMATKYLETGQGRMADVLRIQMELDKLKNQVETLEDELQTLTAKLNAQRNVTQEKSVYVPDTLAPATTSLSRKALHDSMLTHNPVLKEHHKHVHALHTNIRSARQAGYPNIGLGLDYINVGTYPQPELPNHGRDALVPAIRFTLPLYRRKYNAQVEEAQRLHLAHENMHEDVLNKMRVALQESYAAHRKARRDIVLYKALQQKTSQTLDLLLTGYTTGNESFDEVLRIEQQLLDYRLAYVAAAAAQYMARARLEYLCGPLNMEN